MFDESTSPTDRLKMLRKTPWWPYFVEALYRDEYESAKAGKIKSASSIAERSVGDTFNVSPELVRKICGEVRRKRKDGTALPDSPAITVTKFEHWKKTGHFDQV
jgi:transposase